jgi:hypothetical protein
MKKQAAPAKSKMMLLCEYIHEQSGKPFAYGVDDCLTFCAGAAMLLTAERDPASDPMKHLRGKYKSEKTAAKKMLEFGTLADVARSCATEISNGEAASGDWALVVNPDGTETLGIIIGGTVWSKSRVGVASCSRERATKFFTVRE